MEWTPWLGFCPLSTFRLVSGLAEDNNPYPDVKSKTMKKWTVAAASPSPDDAPPPQSVVLKKFPRLAAFLSDRWYDDKSPRLPGAVWLDSDLGGFKAMLKEPSMALCARIRASTLDDLFAALEQFLGLDNPPWEPDQYALGKSDKKKKK